MGRFLRLSSFFLSLNLLLSCQVSQQTVQISNNSSVIASQTNKIKKNASSPAFKVKRDIRMKDGTYCYVLDNLRLDEDGLATLRFKYETLRGYTCPKHKIYDIFTYPKDVLKQVSGIKNRIPADPFFVRVAPTARSVSIKFLKANKVRIQKYKVGYSISKLKKLINNQCKDSDLDICLAEKSVPSWEKSSKGVLSNLKQKTDRSSPRIKILSPSITPKNKLFRVDTYQTYVRGKVTDNEGVMTVLVNGRKAGVKADGSFASKLKLAFGKNTVSVQAEDVNGNVAERKFTIIREEFIPEQTLADVDMPPKTTMNNPDAVAVVIGVENYQYVADATYAYNDAEVFREYLSETLGFKKSKIKIATNSKATLAELNKLLGYNGWLSRNVKPGKSDVVVYFSGHGIPDAKTKKTGLLPFDVDPNYSVGLGLKDLYRTLGSLQARSVTVFLDTCFSGQGREKQTLLADTRGIMIVPKEKAIPDNVTVLSAATAGQISGPIKDKEHGLFTYYLLKGLGGTADANKDKKLTMAELTNYVSSKVKEDAAIKGREQTPELQGSANRVLVQW